jgi:hypothetical protein
VNADDERRAGRVDVYAFVDELAAALEARMDAQGAFDCDHPDHERALP